MNQGQLIKQFTRNKQLLNNPNYRINDDFIKPEKRFLDKLKFKWNINYIL